MTSPSPGYEDSFFWNGLRDRHLLLQRCADCRTLCHPPLPMCPSCQSVDREAIEATGQGKVHSWIVSSHPSQPGGPSDIVGLIDLDEGLRLVANLTGLEGRTVTNDMPVEVVFVDGADYVFPQFRPMIEAPE